MGIFVENTAEIDKAVDCIVCLFLPTHWTVYAIILGVCVNLRRVFGDIRAIIADSTRIVKPTDNPPSTFSDETRFAKMCFRFSGSRSR